jgi:cytochrome c biogenesis protein CcmG, thiol:disulfide interchange protein DsbE
MRQTIRLSLFTILGCALVAGCDRGASPRQIGNPAPTFAVNDGQNSVDLAKLRGKVVILNFWASWCAPCIEEMPSLEALHHELPEVQVVAVDSDEEFTQYQTYILQHHIDLTTVFDEKQASNTLYGSFRFPETYIIDKQGVVRRKLIGAQEFTNPDFITYLRKLAS